MNGPPLEEIESQSIACGLDVIGGFHPVPDDQVPVPCATLLLLGPRAPTFWPLLTASPEWQDGQPDPVDRWSERVVGALGRSLDAQPLFPFGGPPYMPFIAWALRTGRVHRSPVGLLVHDTAGLMVSFRGALAFQNRLDLPEPPTAPCDTCVEKPCKTACPVDALGDHYDVPACKSFLDTDAGSDCMMAGCLARRVCPVSAGFPRQAAQSAYHMRMFKG